MILSVGICIQLVFALHFSSASASNCVPDPCKNAGTCIPWSKGYWCVCDKGYQGQSCETDINECTAPRGQPCKNGGTCVNSPPGDYTCNCVEGYKGKNCEQALNECVPKPCENGGTCIPWSKGFWCVCEKGYQGQRCETDINECTALRGQPCQNGGTCVNNPGSYTCTCPEGYEGDNCEKDIDECVSTKPCENGGTCVNNPGGYTCNCVEGFTGENCEEQQKTAASNCDSDPCENDAMCIPWSKGFWCVCDDGYEGQRCEIDINECTAPRGQPCKNGGTCANNPGSYTCTCPEGYEGDNCEKGNFNRKTSTFRVHWRASFPLKGIIMNFCLISMIFLVASFHGKLTTMAGKLEGFKHQETGVQEEIRDKRSLVGIEDLILKYQSLKVKVTSLETRLSQLTNKVNGRWVHCLDKYTGWDSYSDAPIMYLDRQSVSCPHGYFVSSFVLKRQGGSRQSNVRYNYRCCKLRF